MLFLNPSHHSCQHANQTLTRATSSSIRNTSPARFLTTQSVLIIYSIINEPVTFVKEFNDDDVAQIFTDTLEKNIKDIYKKIKFPKGMIMAMNDNWRFHSVSSLDLRTVKYVPLGGSSYIPLSKFLAAKKAIIYLKNDDDECFKWAIKRALKSSRKNL